MIPIGSSSTRVRRRPPTCGSSSGSTGSAGLANRHLFHSRLTAALTSPDRRPARTGAGILYLDLDGLKKINDVHGHLAGDAVLQAAAGRLEGQVRAQDTVARLGGDEFIIVMPEADQPSLAKRLQELEHAVSDIGRKHSNSLQFSISFGLATYGVDGTDADSLLAKADQRMYQSKRERKSTPQHCPILLKRPA